jgi:uncharacterized membrane protein YheB (UPF0754 family)
MIWTLLALPLIGALIGWFTNYLAVKMIFRPAEPIRVFPGLTLQGLIPKRRQELAHKIAETVEQELLGHQDIRGALEDPEYQAHFLSLLEQRFEGFSQNHMGQMNPLIQAFISPELASKVKEALVKEVADHLPALVKSMASHLEDKLDFRQIVTSRIEGFEIDRLESIVLRIASKELKHIELLGALLGFLIGVVQAVLAYLAV